MSRSPVMPTTTMRSGSCSPHVQEAVASATAHDNHVPFIVIAVLGTFIALVEQNPVKITAEVPKPMVVEKTIEVPKIVIQQTIVKVPKTHNTVVHSQVQDQIQTSYVHVCVCVCVCVCVDI